jgi:hypothetical protein
MEVFEEEALKRAAYKPLCWFRYVDDTFVIWPHGRQKLDDFLLHLNNIHTNIQFTMETERDGRIAFLDIDVYRNGVYRKLTHTNLYLSATSHHRPANKQAILSTLVYRAKAICDSHILPREFKFLHQTFQDSGYSEWQIFQALSPSKSPTTM